MTPPVVTLVLPDRDAVAMTAWQAVRVLLPMLTARQLGEVRKAIHPLQLIANGVKVTPFVEKENGHAP